MKRKSKKVPEFRSDDAERRFWTTRDSSDYPASLASGSGAGFIEIGLPGYAASSTQEYATAIPERWLPVEIIHAPVAFVVNGVETVNFSHGAIDENGTLSFGRYLAPFNWRWDSFGQVSFDANGIVCEFPADADTPECAGNHRWGWSSTAVRFRVPGAADLGLAGLGLLILCAAIQRRPLNRRRAGESPPGAATPLPARGPRPSTGDRRATRAGTPRPASAPAASA